MKERMRSLCFAVYIFELLLYVCKIRKNKVCSFEHLYMLIEDWRKL